MKYLIQGGGIENRYKTKKYSEYSSEQAVEAINRCPELYREYLKKGENNFSVLHNEN